MWETIQEPDDGWTQYEKMIMRETIVSMYKIIGDTTNRFIVAMICECGYSQTDVARMLGVSQVAITKRYHSTIDKMRRKHDEGRIKL